MTAPAGQPGRGRAALPTLMLVLVTVFWGLSFPLMKTWQEVAKGYPGGESVAAFTLIAARMALALFFLALLSPRLYAAPDWRECRVGGLLGGVFFLGFSLQVVGLTWTTPALSAFITSLGSAWVPLLAWLGFGATIRGLALIGMGLGVAGTVILGLTGTAEGAFGKGEALTLLASWVFAAEILLLDRLGRTLRSAHLTAPFLATTGLLAMASALVTAWRGPGVGAWLSWVAGLLADGAILRDLGILALFSTVLAFHWMNVYQPRVSANRAALVYLLEPVFGTAFSILWGHDSLTGRLALGGCLILSGNLLVEAPGWGRRDMAPGSPPACR